MLRERAVLGAPRARAHNRARINQSLWMKDHKTKAEILKTES